MVNFAWFPEETRNVAVRIIINYLLVVAGSVTSELEDLSAEVLEDGSEVHGGTSADTLGIAAVAEVAVKKGDNE